MPDQQPSAILDSTNSFDSIFALELDTKHRFDNILSGVQKPIDYPLPDFQKDLYPNGLPQSDLLSPTKMKGSIGEALFSSDPRVSAYATDRLRQSQSKLPVNQGIGVQDHFAYAPQMDKFLNGDYGYNPNISIEDNEDFNYRYDYLSHNVLSRSLINVGTGITRFLGSVGVKLGQTVGYMGSMIGNGIEEIFNSKANNFMADVADNSLSRWFEGLETDMKNSNLLEVFKPRGWEDMGFFNKLGHGAFWTDEVADGAAFMGEMVASMYLMGGLGKIGALGRLGATEIKLGEQLAKLGRYGSALGKAGRLTGRGLDAALKLSTGADDLSGVGRWAFSVTSEAAFEASEGYKTSMDDLKARRTRGEEGYVNMSDEEMRLISGDRAASRFKSNLMILSASNAFENRFIFGPLFKKFGAAKPSPIGRNIAVSESTETLEGLAKATRKEFDYSTWLGKKLNWKDSNSRLRFYGSTGLSAVAAEGFWEENAQLASERLAGADNLTFSSFFGQLSDQTIKALKGDDPEAATSIGLGGLIGVLGTSVVAKVRGGDRLFQGERRKLEQDTLKAISIYEQFRKGFLSYQDLYELDAQGKPLIDAETGKPKVDPIKLAGILNGTNKFVSKLSAADAVDDPLLRKHIQDEAMMDYVVAAKMAGIFDKSAKRFDSLKNIDPAKLEELGFDPNTTIDAAYLQDSLHQFGKIYDQIQKSPPAKKGTEDTPEDELNRKHYMYKTAASVYSTNKIINEFNSKMEDRDFPSVFSPEAAGNDPEVQAYNSLLYQEAGIRQFESMVGENTTLYNDHIKAEKKRILSEKIRLLASIKAKQALDAPKPGEEQQLPSLITDERGFYYSPLKYQGYSDVEISMMLDQENSAQKKHAEYTNIRNQHQYLLNKFSNPQDGIKNTKAYRSYIEEIQRRDTVADLQGQSAQGQTQPAATTATATQPAQQPNVQVPAPPAPMAEKTAVENEQIVTTLTTMLKSARDSFTANPEDKGVLHAILDFMEDNEGKNDEVITKVLVDFITSAGTIVTESIQNNTFSLDNITVKLYMDTSEFMNQLMLTGMEENKSEALLNYMDTVDAAIAAYKAPTVELTDQEVAAIEALSQKDYKGTPVEPYTSVIINPDSSNAEKRQALKELSDQLLDPNTAEVVGVALGRPASEAVENLGYEAPKPAQEPEPEPKPEEKVEVPKVFEPVGVYLISQEPDGKWMLYNDAQQSLGLTYDTKEDAIKDALKPVSEETREALGIEYKAGDRVAVNTKKDGEATIKEIRDGKALLDDGRQVLIENLLPVSVAEEPVTPPPPTHAEIASADTEGSDKGVEPPSPPAPPVAPPNTEQEFHQSNNIIDVMIDESKRQGVFTFPQNMPEEVVMEGPVAKITNGAVQLKTTQGDQQRQLLRQHNILKVMGDKNSPVNFWSEDENGQREFKIKLELAGARNAGTYSPWVYDTAQGQINPATGKPYLFPFVVAVVVDQEGNYVYFTDDGKPTIKTRGLPFGFPYTIEDYKGKNIDLSRRGVQLGTGEPLNGIHGFENDDPTEDLKQALLQGIEIYGSIDMVTSGKLSSYNVDNSGATWAKEPKQRTVKQMIEDGDLHEDTTFSLEESGSVEMLASPLMAGNEQTTAVVQNIKVGQPYVFDNRSGVRVPLRGKKIKDLTINGKPLVEGKLKEAIEELQSRKGRGMHMLNLEDEEPTAEQLEQFQSIFTLLRAILYSKNTPVFLSEDGKTIGMLDQRPENIPLMETEINFSQGIQALQNPFDEEGEYGYEDFVKENFLSGAVPAELTKGQKNFEKLNKRIIFTLEKNHRQIIDSLGAKGVPANTTRVKTTDFSKFVGKTYGRRGQTSTVTVTSFKDGQVTIKGPTGEVTKPAAEFVKDLRNLQEISLPKATDEVTQEMNKDIKLSKEKIDEIREQSKNMTDKDVDDLDFGC